MLVYAIEGVRALNRSSNCVVCVCVGEGLSLLGDVGVERVYTVAGAAGFESLLILGSIWTIE